MIINVSLEDALSTLFEESLRAENHLKIYSNRCCLSYFIKKSESQMNFIQLHNFASFHYSSPCTYIITYDCEKHFAQQHNHVALCKETCLYLFWLNWWWHRRRAKLKSCDNFSEVTQIQFDFWQGDAIYKTEHAISGARHLHNEDTSISASNVFDSL